MVDIKHFQLHHLPIIRYETRCDDEKQTDSINYFSERDHIYYYHHTHIDILTRHHRPVGHQLAFLSMERTWNQSPMHKYHPGGLVEMHEKHLSTIR